MKLTRKQIDLPELSTNLGLMAEGADAIIKGYYVNGFTRTRVVCWFHTKKTLKSRLAKN